MWSSSQMTLWSPRFESRFYKCACSDRKKELPSVLVVSVVRKFSLMYFLVTPAMCSQVGEVSQICTFRSVRSSRQVMS